MHSCAETSASVSVIMSFLLPLVVIIVSIIVIVIIFSALTLSSLQCFDAVGWAAGRASGL